MANELVPFDYSRQVANGMDYRFFMEKALTQDNTRAIANAIRDNSERLLKANAAIGAAQVSAINNQTTVLNAGFNNVNNTLNAGFDSVNTTLALGFDQMEYQLGQLGVSFTAGAGAIIDATFKMSEAVCDRLDVLADIANNPRRTQAREFYRDGVRNYIKGLYEEARDYLKQAVEKDITDFRSWHLLGIMYLRGKSEYSDVINLDNAINALTNAVRYISPEITEYNKKLDGFADFYNRIPRPMEIISYEASQKKYFINEIREIIGLGLEEANSFVENKIKIYFYGDENKFKVEAKKWGAEGNITLFNQRGNCYCKLFSAEKYQELFIRLTSAGASVNGSISSYIPNPKPLAAEILFYLAQAKRFKSNELESAGKLDEAGKLLLEAQKDYEKSWANSNKMLEARYNTARCKALLGDKDGVLSDLDELIKMNNAYSVKVEIDSDFDTIREAYRQRRVEEEQRRLAEVARREAEEKK